jgi:NTP pyrophosphatase (non-canonical NTP hydrolase)
MKIFKDTYDWLETAKTKKPSLASMRKWINEELDEFEEAIESEDLVGMYDAIVDANIFLANIAYHYGLTTSILESFSDAIYKSNMSKFCKTEQEAIETITAYANGTHPNKPGVTIDANFYESNGFYIVYNTSDGKILKSINFIDTDKFI